MGTFKEESGLDGKFTTGHKNVQGIEETQNNKKTYICQTATAILLTDQWQETPALP